MRNQQPSNKRQLFLLFISLFGMLIGAHFIQMLFYPNQEFITPLAPAKDTQGTLTNKKFGKIYSTSTDAVWEMQGKSGKTYAGKEVSEGEIIQTGKNGYIEIQLGDTSLLRLATESRVEFHANRRIRLLSGNLWLRSISSENTNYTLDAGDLETHISSTAVTLEKIESGATLIFINSGISDSEVTYEAFTESGSGEGSLKAEESYTIKDGQGKKKRENMDRLLGQEFYAYSLKRDLIFLHALAKNTPSIFDVETREKIENELESSFPKKAEIEKFFLSSAIRDEVRQFIRYNPQYGSGNLTSSSLTSKEESELLIACIEDDLEFGEMKLQLKKMREGQGNMSDSEREVFQNEVNTLENSIRNFEATWSEKQRVRRKEYLLMRGQGMVYPPENIENTRGEAEPSGDTLLLSTEKELDIPTIPAKEWIMTSGQAMVSGSAR